MVLTFKLSKLRRIKRLVESLLELVLDSGGKIQTIQAQQKEIMTALENLADKINALGGTTNQIGVAVDSVLSHINTPSPTDAQLNTLASTVETITAGLQNHAKRLTDAINETPEAPPTPAPV